MDKFRVGIGQDSHPIKIKDQRLLILGGVIINSEMEVEANSDGDVVLHALCNALSSAIGGDSLSTWADTICLEKGITDSKEFVKVIMDKVKKEQYTVNNISIAIEAKRPRVNPQQVSQMKVCMGTLLSISTTSIGITFTSGEGLTAFGKGEGIQVIAIVSLVGI